MGLNLGLLGQVAMRGMGGYQKGLISAEETGYKRKREKEERDREIAHQALMETLAQNAENRSAADQVQQTEDYNYKVTQRPGEEAKARAELERTNRQNLPDPADPDADLKRQELEARIANYRSQTRERGKPKPEESPNARRRKYIAQHMSERTKPRTQRDPLSGEITVLPGDSPEAAYRALSEEYDLIEAGKVPEHAQPQMRKGNWEPTDMNPGRSVAPPGPADTVTPPEVPPDSAQSLPPLEPEDVRRAQTDPEFRAWLESQGYQ